MPHPYALVDASGLLHELWLVLHQGENGDLDRCHARVEPEQSSLLAADLQRWKEGGEGIGGECKETELKGRRLQKKEE